MLVNKRASILQIAADLRFADESGFRRTFSQVLVIALAKFREGFQNTD
jgi:hypothetical protein